MLTKQLAAVALLAGNAAATIYYAGVAESGGEFGVYSMSIGLVLQARLTNEGSSATVGTGLPGRFGVDYQFINEATVDTYVDQNGVSFAPFLVGQDEKRIDRANMRLDQLVSSSFLARAYVPSSDRTWIDFQ